MRSEEELWEALLHLDDSLNADVPSEIIDAELRDLGLDPEAVAVEGLQWVVRCKAINSTEELDGD